MSGLEAQASLWCEVGFQTCCLACEMVTVSLHLSGKPGPDAFRCRLRVSTLESGICGLGGCVECCFT